MLPVEPSDQTTFQIKAQTSSNKRGSADASTSRLKEETMTTTVDRSSKSRSPSGNPTLPKRGLAREPQSHMKLSRALIVMVLLHIVAIGGVITFSMIKERHPTQAGSQTTAPLISSNAPTLPPKNVNAPPSPSSSQVNASSLNSSLKNVVSHTQPSPLLGTYTPPQPTHLVTSPITNNTSQSFPKPVNVLPKENESHLPPTKSVITARDVYHEDAKFIADTPFANRNLPPSKSNKKTSPKAQTFAASVKEHQHSQPLKSKKTYSVIKGDTLYSIAHHFNIGFETLRKINKIQDPTKLKIGQQLVLPTAPNPGSNTAKLKHSLISSHKKGTIAKKK